MDSVVQVMNKLTSQLGVGKYIPTPDGYKQIVEHYNQYWWQKVLYHVFDIEVLKVRLEK